MRLDTRRLRTGILRVLGIYGIIGIGWVAVSLAETSPAQGNSALADQPWAIQFQINNNFTLSAFQGTTISAKYHFSPRQAVRFGVGIDTARRTTDYENDQPSIYLANDLPIRTTLDEYLISSCWMPEDFSSQRKASNMNLTGVMQYLRIVNPDRRVTMFLAAGPVFGLERWSEKTEQSYGEENKYTRKSWKVGVTLSLGAEWFVARNISLLAEYGVQADYFHSKLDDRSWYEYDPPYKETEDGLELVSLPVKFGVSVYF